MERIVTEADLVRALDELEAADPRLAPVRTRAGKVELRLSEPTFNSLASIVIGQQVSRASAQAMLNRLHELVQPLTAPQLLSSDPELLIRAGLSRAKQRTLLSLASAVEVDGLNLTALVELPSVEAIEALVRLPGIGPWTAEVFMLTSGHPDIFPSRDVALQEAVRQGLNLDGRPDAHALASTAKAWQPWRSVAARLFWAYYRELKGRDAIPISETA